MSGDPKNFLPEDGKVPEKRELKDLTERLGLIIKAVSGKPKTKVTTEVDFNTLMRMASQGKDGRKEWFRQSRYDPKTRRQISELVHIPDQIFEENENVAKGKAAHEAGHVAITRGGEFIPDEVMQDMGFHALFGGVEERPTDQVVRERYSGAGEWLDEARSLEAQRAVQSSRQEDRGKIPKFAQFASICVYAPHYGESFPADYDPDVIQKYRELSGEVEAIENTLPAEGADEEEILNAAKERYKRLYTRVWPEVKKFVEEDKREQELAELLREMLQSQEGGEGDEGGDESGPPAGGSQEEKKRREELQKQLKEIMDGLPEEVKQALKELEQKLQEQKKQARKNKAQKGPGQNGGKKDGGKEGDGPPAGGGGDGAGEKGEKVEGEGKDGNGSGEAGEKEGAEGKEGGGKNKRGGQKAGAGETAPAGAKTGGGSGAGAGMEAGGEQGEGAEPGEPASSEPPRGEPSLNDLNESERENLEKLFDALPEETKEFLRYAAKKALEELEDRLTKQWSGKLDESPAETHAEFGERKEGEAKEKEKEAKKREGKKESKKELQEIEKRQVELGRGRGEYDRTYDSVREFDERLYRRLEEIFTPNVKRTMRLRDTGAKLNLPAVFKWKASRSAGASAIENKIFESTHLPEKKDYAFVILVDLSGSMLQQNRIQQTFKGVVLLAEVLNRLGVKVEILGFHDRVFEFKKFSDDLTDAVREKMSRILHETRADNGTQMAEALHMASGHLEQVPGKEKFLLTLTDGIPNDWGLTVRTVGEILKLKSQKLVGVGFGGGAQAVKKLFPAAISDIEVKDLPEGLGALLEDIITNPAKYAALSETMAEEEDDDE